MARLIVFDYLLIPLFRKLRIAATSHHLILLLINLLRLFYFSNLNLAQALSLP